MANNVVQPGKKKLKSDCYEQHEVVAIWRLVDWLSLSRSEFYAALVAGAQRVNPGRKNWRETFAKAFSKSEERRTPLIPRNRPIFVDALTNLVRGRGKMVSAANIEAFVEHPSEDLLNIFKSAQDYISVAQANADRASPEFTAFWTRNCYFEFSRIQGQYDRPMDACLDWGIERFCTNGNDDVFLLAILAWNLLGRGTADRIRRFAPILGQFLEPKRQRRLGFDLDAWQQAINTLLDPSVNREDQMFLRRHLDDALARSAMLAYLHDEGNASLLAGRIRNAAATTALPHQIERIFSLADGPDWLSKAIEAANNWCNVDTTSSTARVNLLWLLGRQEKIEAIRPQLERVCRWLDQHPQHGDALVRWGTIWLAGMSDHYIEKVLQQTRAWLKLKEAADDRVVHLSYFWLVGEKGFRADVDTAFADAKKWFQGPFRDDRTIRIGYIVWLVTRAYLHQFITKEEFAREVGMFRTWAVRHSSPLVTAALKLAATLEREPSA